MIDQVCKLCGNNYGEEILNVSKEEDTYLDFLRIPYKDVQRFYKRCGNCGFVYRNMALETAEKNKLYTLFRDFELRGETYEQYFQRIVNLPNEKSENYEKYTFLANYIKTSGKHMDVGGGLGVFCFGFKRFFPNWDTSFVEPSDGAAEIAKVHGLKCINSYLTPAHVSNLGADFDLITLVHVLEHIDDPEDFLRLISSFLSKTGLLYIEMPSALDVGFLKSNHDRFMCQHEVIHDNASLMKIGLAAGYEVVFNDNFMSARGRNNLRALLKLRQTN